jgi:hypothetical protein
MILGNSSAVKRGCLQSIDSASMMQLNMPVERQGIDRQLRASERHELEYGDATKMVNHLSVDISRGCQVGSRSM